MCIRDSSPPLSPLLMGLEVQNPTHGNRDTIIFAAQHTQVMSTLFAELKRMCFNLTVSELTALKYTEPSASFVSEAVSYTHLRAHETPEHLVCRLLLEKKKNNKKETTS
eukprot:TRINITY_DN7510_c0_g1_i1.p1 TRINITY_DN7510_c0_g1~~TRINITY_DN7510_c0_g1_i1.p1  ORF type:complete len:109 (-),score=32.14 TRINITY_DN7510_c0_g1_i1:38-364(-)